MLEDKLRRRKAWEAAQRVGPGEDSNGSCSKVDRFHVYQMLLEPLEHVRENIERHPEGDVLYHSLQVFDLARQELPYDEEFLLAALLHDVGKGLDRREHIEAAVAALDGFVTPADRLDGRAPLRRPCAAQRHARRAGAAAIGSLGELRGTDAPGRVRRRRPPQRRIRGPTSTTPSTTSASWWRKCGE